LRKLTLKFKSLFDETPITDRHQVRLVDWILITKANVKMQMQNTFQILNKIKRNKNY